MTSAKRHAIGMLAVALAPFLAANADDGQVESRMFELTYANAAEGIQSLDLRDLEDRASETKRE